MTRIEDDSRDVQRCSPWEGGFIVVPQRPAFAWGLRSSRVPMGGQQGRAWQPGPVPLPQSGAAGGTGAAPALGIGHLPAWPG